MWYYVLTRNEGGITMTIINDVRKLNTMPFDKVFDGENCHATGFEIFDGKEWWNEYESTDGTLYYGR